jgi:hypothetical protein
MKIRQERLQIQLALILSKSNNQSMNSEKKYGFIHLAKKAVAIITTSLGVLSAQKMHGQPQVKDNERSEDEAKVETYKNSNQKPKLLLKIRSHDPADYLLAQHRSHSSHRSHASHRSHYSSSSARGGGGGGGGGLGVGALVVGGLLAIGAYGLGRKSKK